MKKQKMNKKRHEFHDVYCTIMLYFKKYASTNLNIPQDMKLKNSYGGRVEKMVILRVVLLGRIKLKRKTMYMKAKSFGFTHPKVVAHSQDLDLLINRYQGICPGR